MFCLIALVGAMVGCGSAENTLPALEPDARTDTSADTGDIGLRAPDAETPASGNETPPAEERETGEDTMYDDTQTPVSNTETETETSEDAWTIAPDGDVSTGDEAPRETPPPVFGFIDAHADTITRALLREQDLYENNLHVDFKRLLEYGSPVQVFALWCSDRYVDNAFEYTNSLIDFFESEVEKHSDIIEIALTPEDLERNARNNKISAVLAIEGGEALMGRLGNLDHFYNRGVRIMTLTWNRENELGYGQATGSTNGLKPFGEECVRRMDELGMIMDISHINEAGFWDAHRLSTRPYMASHSNAYALAAHPRNLTDAQITAIVERGGIVGLAFYPLLLSTGGKVDIGDIIAHIGHFIELGAGDNIGFGSDFDGFNNMPEGIVDVSSFMLMGEKISEAFGETVSAKVMSGNFYEFFVRYFS